jgi:hypothetical protein
MSSEKPSDQLVDAKAILEAIAGLKRRGNKTIIQELEFFEPELIGHVMEELSLLYQELSRNVASAGNLRRVYWQIESLVLVSILSLRKAQQRLWQDFLDPPPSPPPPL